MSATSLNICRTTGRFAFSSSLSGLLQPAILPSPVSCLAFSSSLSGLLQPPVWPSPVPCLAFSSPLNCLLQPPVVPSPASCQPSPAPYIAFSSPLHCLPQPPVVPSPDSCRAFSSPLCCLLQHLVFTLCSSHGICTPLPPLTPRTNDKNNIFSICTPCGHMTEWRCSSTYSYARHSVEMSGPVPRVQNT